MNEDWITVGRIRTAFGVKGWLKLESFTEPAENIEHYSQWRLCRGRQITPIVLEEMTIKQVDPRRTDILVRLEGINDREQARLLANSLVQVPKAELPSLDEEDFYWHQLEGLDVYQVASNQNDSGAGQMTEVPVLVGQVTSLLETGANDVLVVKPATEEGSQQGAEILIPYLPDQVIKLVEIEKGRILVDWYYD